MGHRKLTSQKCWLSLTFFLGLEVILQILDSDILVCTGLLAGRWE